MSCPDCFSGHVHEGHPRGKTINLHGLDAYVTEPANNNGPVRGIIVIIPDAFGWEFVNNRILADHYADKGNYKVYLPDFMLGHSAPLWILDTMHNIFHGSLLSKPLHIFWALYGFIPFIARNRIGRSFPVVEKFFSELRKAEGADLPVAAAGFCWGGKHTFLLARNTGDEALIDVAFVGHPSFVDFPGDINNIKLPLSIAIGDRDNQIPPKMAAEIKTMFEKQSGGVVGEIRVYENCGHGFCVRADAISKDPDTARQAAEAEDQCIEWFNKHLGQRS